MKTSELTGAALDWAVAICEEPNIAKRIDKKRDPSLISFFNPSTDWAQGGPIIEREKIKVFPNVGGTWSAQIRHTEAHPLVSHPVLAGWTNSSGQTPLIAAMRCYVASKFGDDMEIPEALK